MSLSLRSKLVCTAAVLLSALVFAFAAVAANRVGGFLRGRLAEKARALATAFAEGSVLGVDSGDRRHFQKVASMLQSDPDVLRLSVHGRTGGPLFAWSRTGEPAGPGAESDRPPIRPRSAVVLPHGGEGRRLEALAPIPDELDPEETGGPVAGGARREPAGVARIVFTLANVDEEASALLVGFATAALAIVGAGVAIALLLAQALTGPLRRLTDGARAIGRGDLEHRIPVGGRDEVGALALSFNDMASRLAESRSRLEAHSQNLEGEVRARTEELRRAYEELKRVDGLKDSFVSSVSHELRTPLTSIRSFAELLLTHPPEGRAEHDEFVTIIKHETERLSRLIEDVLDLSKIESGSVNWRREPLDLAEVVRHVAAALRPLFEEGGMRIEVRSAGDLPSVVGDRDRLVQVVTNLLSNARKFSPAGASVEVLLGGDAREARCAVRDRGPGIPREFHETIFEKFKQLNEEADPLTSKPRGTGLGLTISREIVHAHGGRTWVESEPGKGSAFVFALPVAAAPARPGEEPSPRAFSAAAAAG